MTVKGRGLAEAIASAVASVLVWLAVWLLLAAGAAPARAHPEYSALGTNRYVTAAAFDGRVDVSDVWLEGLLVSSDDRRRLDADGDGRISDAELTAVERRLATEGAAVTVELDGRPLVGAVDVAIDLGGEPLAESAPVAVERRLSFPGVFAPGAHRLRLAIAREAPHPLDTEIGVVLGPGLTLAGTPDRAVFRGPRVSALEDRAGVFDFTAPAPPARGRGVAVASGAGGLVVVVLVLVLVVARLRRRRRSARG